MASCRLSNCITEPVFGNSIFDIHLQVKFKDYSLSQLWHSYNVYMDSGSKIEAKDQIDEVKEVQTRR